MNCPRGCEFGKLLSAEEDGKVFVQPAAPIVACVDDDRLFVAATAQQLGSRSPGSSRCSCWQRECSPLVRWKVCRPTRVLVYTLVKQSRLRTVGDGLDRLFEALFLRRVIDREAYLLAGFAAEERIEVLARLDGLPVYLLDDASTVTFESACVKGPLAMISVIFKPSPL